MNKREYYEEQLKHYTGKIIRIIDKLPGTSACVLFTKGTEDGLEVAGTYSIENPYFDDDTHKAVLNSWIDWIEKDALFEKKPEEE